MQLGKRGTIERLGVPEVVVRVERLDLSAAAVHRLKQQEVLGGVLVNEVERQQRMTKVIEHAHEHDEIEALTELTDVVNRQLAKFDVEAAHPGGKARLRQIFIDGVDADDARCAAALQLHRVETGVAADVEDRVAGEIARNGVGEAAPFDGRIIAEKMLRRGANTVEVEIVKPGAKRVDLPLDFLG